jgi:hypothetical protein
MAGEGAAEGDGAACGDDGEAGGAPEGAACACPKMVETMLPSMLMELLLDATSPGVEAGYRRRG